MPHDRTFHEARNAEAAKAAQWMKHEMARNDGVLTQDCAWKGVREQFGSDLAPSNPDDNWLAKVVLSAFRKLTPETVWDPIKKHWRGPRRSDNLADGARILSPAKIVRA